MTPEMNNQLDQRIAELKLGYAFDEWAQAQNQKHPVKARVLTRIDQRSAHVWAIDHCAPRDFMSLVWNFPPIGGSTTIGSATGRSWSYNHCMRVQMYNPHSPSYSSNDRHSSYGIVISWKAQYEDRSVSISCTIPIMHIGKTLVREAKRRLSSHEVSTYQMNHGTYRGTHVRCYRWNFPNDEVVEFAGGQYTLVSERSVHAVVESLMNSVTEQS